MLGYSRGTPLALEMVTQAEKNGLSYLANVKALVSYAGVVMGSSLANETDDATTTNGKLTKAIETFMGNLKDGLLVSNMPAIVELVRTLSENNNADDVMASNSDEPSQITSFIMTGDLRAVGFAFIKVADQLGFTNITQANARTVRLKKFFGDVLAAVNGLKTKSLSNWWATHTLPKNIQYMSIAAGMDESGYTHSLDDIGLKGNMRTYAKATNGVLMNDSQVAIHQAVFYPNIIKNLNSANEGLTIKQLGLLNTHHWGVSLQVVNKMREKEDAYFNKFPRENVLKALIAFINQDQ